MGTIYIHDILDLSSFDSDHSLLSRASRFREINMSFQCASMNVQKMAGGGFYGRMLCGGEEHMALVKYIIWMADHGFPLTRTIIKSLALEILKDSGQKTLVNTERCFTDNWWSHFKARHPELTTRIPDSLDRARVLAATPVATERFFSLRTEK